jgi:hypothetical protein
LPQKWTHAGSGPELAASAGELMQDVFPAGDTHTHTRPGAGDRDGADEVATLSEHVGVMRDSPCVWGKDGSWARRLARSANLGERFALCMQARAAVEQPHGQQAAHADLQVCAVRIARIAAPLPGRPGVGAGRQPPASATQGIFVMSGHILGSRCEQGMYVHMHNCCVRYATDAAETARVGR